MHVHLLYPPELEHLNELNTLLDKDIFITTGEIQPNQPTTILVAGRPTYQELQLLNDLKTLVVPWTGIPPETLAAVKRLPPLKLHNLHHNTIPVSEMAITLLLAAAKRVIPFDQHLRGGNWELRYQEPVVPLLAGKRALIVGYGEIGRRISSILVALDIKVKAIRRTPESGSGTDIHRPDELRDLLPETDILFLTLPLTSETESLISKNELALLPDAAILINISRGKVVDQEALYIALKENHLFGAGLDVWYNYPADQESRSNTLPGDFPFHELENLVLSPHRGGLVRETEILRMKDLAVLLNAAARDEQIPNSVNINLGY